MLIVFKNLIRYLLTITVVAMITAVLVYILSCFIVSRIDRVTFLASLLDVFLFKFITYNLYLFVYYSIKRNDRIFIQGVVCVAIEYFSLNIFFYSLAGLTFQTELFILVTSACSISVPLIHHYLNKLMGLTRPIN